MTHKICLLLFLSLCLILPAHAQEQEKKEEIKTQEKQESTPLPFTYEREYCDFSISFPEEPTAEQKCDETEQCYEIISYAQIVDVSSSIHFRVTCNPAEEGTKDQYSEAIMRQTLKSMMGGHDLEIHKISSKEFPHAKHAGLLGFGMREQNEKMLLLHLWIGENSIFTLEAELSGPENETINKTLAETLRSITIKQDEKENVEPKK